MKLLRFLSITIIVTTLLTIITNYLVKIGLRNSKIELNGKLNFVFEKNHSVELLLIGSSRVLQQLNPEILDSITHLNSYNFAVQGATIKTSYNISKIVIDNQASAKILLLNIDFFMFNTDIDLWKDPRFYPYENKTSKFAYDSISTSSSFFHKLKIFDVAFYDDNIKYIALDGLLRPNRTIPNNYKGYSPKVSQSFTLPKTSRNKKEKIVFSKKGLGILMDLINLCKEKKVKLMFVNAPYRIDYFPSDYFENYTPIIDSVVKIAKRENIPYLDFSRSELSSKKELFFDFNHLNSDGANMYSILVANEIKKYY